jgi:hypothetical protein
MGFAAVTNREKSSERRMPKMHADTMSKMMEADTAPPNKQATNFKIMKAFRIWT